MVKHIDVTYTLCEGERGGWYVMTDRVPDLLCWADDMSTALMLVDADVQGIHPGAELFDPIEDFWTTSHNVKGN